MSNPPLPAGATTVPPLPRGAITVDAEIDRSTGAPANVRAAVGSAQTPQDRLATIRQFYPDAQPFGSDNFLFRNPRTGQPMLYNPPGFQWVGDTVSALPEVGEALGGFVGGALAVPPAVATAAPTGGMSALAVPAGVGLGAAAGREIATLAGSLIGGAVDTRGPARRALDAGSTAALNAAAVPVAALAERGVRAALGPVGRIVGGRGQATADDFARAGVRASAGDVTGNPGTQSIQASVAAAPTGTRRMATFAEGQTDDLGRAVTQAAESIGVPTTPQNAGAALREGAGAAVERFTSRQGQLYDDAFRLIGANSRVDFPAVRALRDRIAAEIEAAPRSAGPRLQPVLARIDNLLADAGPDGLAFGAMRRERTALGQTIGAPSVSASAPSPERVAYLRQLYGALTEDMTTHARATGGDAARALSLADRYTRFNRTVNLPILERIQRQATDQQVFDLAFPRSGRPDVGTLGRIVRNMTREERSTLAATILDRMGTPTPGAQAAEDFSAATFLTNWNRLNQNGPAARRLLFGPEDAELGRSLDRLVRVASAIRDTSRYTNWSNTGRTVAGLAVAGAVGNEVMQGDVGGFVRAVGLTLVAPAVGARLLTSPAFVNWLSSAGPTMIEQGASPGVLRSLARVATVNPSIREALAEYQNAITSQPPQRPQ